MSTQLNPIGCDSTSVYQEYCLLSTKVKLNIILQAVNHHTAPVVDLQSKQQILDSLLKRIRKTYFMSHSKGLHSIK